MVLFWFKICSFGQLNSVQALEDKVEDKLLNLPIQDNKRFVANHWYVILQALYCSWRIDYSLLWAAEPEEDCFEPAKSSSPWKVSDTPKVNTGQVPAFKLFTETLTEYEGYTDNGVLLISRLATVI